MVRPHSAQRERVWDMAIRILRNLISTVTHDSFPLSLLSRGVGIVGATGARAHLSLQQAVVKKIAKSYNKPVCQV